MAVVLDFPGSFRIHAVSPEHNEAKAEARGYALDCLTAATSSACAAALDCSEAASRLTRGNGLHDPDVTEALLSALDAVSALICLRGARNEDRALSDAVRQWIATHGGDDVED